jgi:F0F1-type ATP synthase membrane subunit a
MEKTEVTKQITTKLSSDSHESLTRTSQEEHHGPHVPLIQGETVYGPISTTVVTTFVFLLLTILVSFFANRALKSQKKSRLKLFFLNYIHFFDGYLRESLGDKLFARRHFVLVVGIFSIVLFGNIF